MKLTDISSSNSQLSYSKDWDSDFFGIKIMAIDSDGSDPKIIYSEIDKLFKNNVKCIYLFSKSEIDLSQYDAILADRKRSYVLKETVDYLTPEPTNYHGSPESLYNLAYQAGSKSRYKIDPHFSEDKFRQLYRKWIDNSINKEFADYVLVKTYDDIPIGFITAKYKARQLSIGLFATDSNYRNQGIGRSLLRQIISTAHRNQCEVEVTTQADNHIACKVYENMGFSIASETFVYHIWNSDNSDISRQ